MKADNEGECDTPSAVNSDLFCDPYPCASGFFWWKCDEKLEIRVREHATMLFVLWLLHSDTVH